MSKERLLNYFSNKLGGTADTSIRPYNIGTILVFFKGGFYMVTVKELYLDKEKYINKEIEVNGWVRTVRDSKTFGFIELNDGSFFKNVQIVFNDSLSNFSEIARSYGAEIVGQDKFALAMECVLSGEADCAINDELTYAYWKQQKGGEDSTKIVAESDDVNSSAVMIKKGNDELISKINSAIDELLADGTVKEISEKYFGMDVSQP